MKRWMKESRNQTAKIKILTYMPDDYVVEEKKFLFYD